MNPNRSIDDITPDPSSKEFADLLAYFERVRPPLPSLDLEEVARLENALPLEDFLPALLAEAESADQSAKDFGGGN